MTNLIRIEFDKLFRRGITYIGFAAILLIVLVIQVGMFVEGKKLLDFLIKSLSDVFMLEGNLINIYTVSYVVLNSLWIHIPVLVAIVAGDMVSGEAGRGTFRLLITRPVSRTKLLTAKYITAQAYTAMLILFLVFMSLGIGKLFFEPGDMIVLMETINIFDASDVLWRFMAAYSYGMVSMWVVSGLAFLFSTRASNSLGPVVASMSVLILFSIISNFSIGIFDPIKPYRFTTYLSGWQLFFAEPLDWKAITNALLIMTAHITVFYLAALYIFRNKDIQS
ncbi:MAG: ABC transporter permease [Bacteroidetes bacterium]|nr:ABC transporter permease [Bacteroidota bacterium]MBU1578472.1 ABC transporter permease [Bacteroidota bacterium]MBU2557725.1 ABC transporter permease [Bacteroidota bacterium]